MVSWIDYNWHVKYSEDQSELRLFIPVPGHLLEWVCSDLLGYDSIAFAVGRFQSSMHKWELAFTSICECGALD